MNKSPLANAKNSYAEYMRSMYVYARAESGIHYQ